MESVFFDPFVAIVCLVCIVFNIFCMVKRGETILFPFMAGMSSFASIVLLILKGASGIEIACMLLLVFLIASTSFVNGGKKK